jgi:hypothetical protein
LGTARAVLDHAAPGAGSCSPAAGISSDTRRTLVPGSGLEESESQGLPVWRRQVGDPMLESNITRRVDFAWFMVAAPNTTK